MLHANELSLKKTWMTRQPGRLASQGHVTPGKMFSNVVNMEFNFLFCTLGEICVPQCLIGLLLLILKGLIAPKLTTPCEGGYEGVI